MDLLCLNKLHVCMYVLANKKYPQCPRNLLRLTSGSGCMFDDIKSFDCLRSHYPAWNSTSL